MKTCSLRERRWQHLSQRDMDSIGVRSEPLSESDASTIIWPSAFRTYDVNTFFRDGNCSCRLLCSAAGDGSCRLIKCNFYYLMLLSIAHRFNRPGSGGGDDVREGDLFVVGTGSQSIRCVQFHFWAGQNDAGVGFFGCDREEGTSIAVCQCDDSVSGLGFRTVIGDNGLRKLRRSFPSCRHCR